MNALVLIVLILCPMILSTFALRLATWAVHGRMERYSVAFAIALLSSSLALAVLQLAPSTAVIGPSLSTGQQIVAMAVSIIVFDMVSATGRFLQRAMIGVLHVVFLACLFGIVVAVIALGPQRKLGPPGFS